MSGIYRTPKGAFRVEKKSVFLKIKSADENLRILLVVGCAFRFQQRAWFREERLLPERTKSVSFSVIDKSS